MNRTPDEANSLLSLSSITAIEQYKVPSENAPITSRDRIERRTSAKESLPRAEQPTVRLASKDHSV